MSGLSWGYADRGDLGRGVARPGSHPPASCWLCSHSCSLLSGNHGEGRSPGFYRGSRRVCGSRGCSLSGNPGNPGCSGSLWWDSSCRGTESEIWSGSETWNCSGASWIWSGFSSETVCKTWIWTLIWSGTVQGNLEPWTSPQSQLSRGLPQTGFTRVS